MTLNKLSQIGNLRHLGTQVDDLFPFLLEILEGSRFSGLFVEGFWPSLGGAQYYGVLSAASLV